MQNAYIDSEAKNGFKGWTKEGLEFLLKDKQNRESRGKLDFHKILQNAIRELEDDND